MTTTKATPHAIQASCAVLLLNWNGWRDTIECLQSVTQSTGVAFSIVVCDNGSHDNSLEQITTWAEAAAKPFALYDREQAEAGGATGQDEPLVLIQTGANLGFAGGNNVGLRYCLAHGGFDYVWVLNNDTVVAPDALQQLVARMQLDPAIGMCGSKLVFYHQRGQVQAYGGSAFEASILVSTPFLQTVGLMCEDYFLYFEEIDWAFRARGKFKLAYADASVVWHKEGGTIGSSSTKEPSATSTRYLYRNRVIFNWRYNRAHFVRCLMQVGFEMLVLLKRKQFKTVKVALQSTLAGLLALRRTGVPYAG